MIGILIAFGLGLLITPFMGLLAKKVGVVDNPAGDVLKIHKKPIPYLGGAAVLLSFLTGILIEVFRAGDYKLLPLILILSAGILIFIVGLFDDIRRVNPKIRILCHIIAGCFILSAGFSINIIPIWWISMPLTLFYIAGAINAFNITDGMDGLCVGISLVSCIGFFFLGLKSRNALLMVLSAILFMSLLGFLPYNFHPARIFLGDAGSGFLGFMLGVMAVMATSKPYNIANFIAPILIICVPVLDMAFAILRRLIQKRALFIGDRDHVYDLLLKRGWSQPKVWFLMCGMQTVVMLGALAI